ncbi:MAG TPA: hypothetical protein VF110_15145, partial [Burkholderiales bacterium]
MSTPQALLAAQLAALCRQWRRVLLPALVVGSIIVYLVWPHAPRLLLVAWGVATVGALLAWIHLCRAVVREGRAPAQPERWSRRLTVAAGLSGAIAGAPALLFLPGLPPAEQALLTLLLGCWGASAVAGNSN